MHGNKSLVLSFTEIPEIWWISSSFI